MDLVDQADAIEKKKKQKTAVTDSRKRSSGARRLPSTKPPAPAKPRTREEYRKAYEKEKGVHPGFHNPVSGEGGLYVPKEGGWTLEEVQAIVKAERDKRDDADTKKLEAAAQAAQIGPLTAGQSLEEGREAEAQYGKENAPAKAEERKVTTKNILFGDILGGQ